MPMDAARSGSTASGQAFEKAGRWSGKNFAGLSQFAGKAGRG